MTLIEIIRDIDTYDDWDEEEGDTRCLTIYAKEPWTPQSEAVVEPPEGDRLVPE